MRLLRQLKERLLKQPEVKGFEFWIEDIHTGIREKIYPGQGDEISGDRLTVRRIGRVDIYHIYQVIPEGKNIVYRVERVRALRASFIEPEKVIRRR